MKEKMLYFECFSGISGDMTVSALLDLGADEGVLRDALDSLHLNGYEISISRKEKCGIDACYFHVALESEKHDHSHDHEHDHSHGHEHDHSHDHEHRNIHQIEKIIENSELTTNSKRIAKEMFGYVARAEALAHGLPIDQVHFHEVGAVDSIVDIVAVAVCIDNLAVKKICISPVYEGQGFVRCQHGVIPVPVPAVVNIAQEKQISLKITENSGEMVTPTGMAILAALKTEATLPEEYLIKKVGIGAGTKNFKQANILRIMEIEPVVSATKEEIFLLETNVDDCSGEAMGFVMDLLFSAGAKDVFFTAIHMKKNRPGQLLSVICDKIQVPALENIIFCNLTTTGIRETSCQRRVLPRKEECCSTSFGEVRFKVCQHGSETYAYPEFEDVKAICLKKNLGFHETYQKIVSEYKKKG